MLSVVLVKKDETGRPKKQCLKVFIYEVFTSYYSLLITIFFVIKIVCEFLLHTYSYWVIIQLLIYVLLLARNIMICPLSVLTICQRY